MVRPTPFDARHCRNSMRLSLDAISANCGFLILVAAPGDSSISLSRHWPRLQTIGLDMSEAYLKHSQRHLKRWTRTGLVAGKAEAIPLPDNSQDAVTNTFLFHELPPKVRRITIRECARVLKPGRPFGNPRFTPTRRSSRLRRALRALPAELSRAVLLELHY